MNSPAALHSASIPPYPVLPGATPPSSLALALSDAQPEFVRDSSVHAMSAVTPVVTSPIGLTVTALVLLSGAAGVFRHRQQRDTALETALEPIELEKLQNDFTPKGWHAVMDPVIEVIKAGGREVEDQASRKPATYLLRGARYEISGTGAQLQELMHAVFCAATGRLAPDLDAVMALLQQTQYRPRRKMWAMPDITNKAVGVIYVPARRDPNRPVEHLGVPRGAFVIPLDKGVHMVLEPTDEFKDDPRLFIRLYANLKYDPRGPYKRPVGKGRGPEGTTPGNALIRTQLPSWAHIRPPQSLHAPGGGTPGGGAPG